MNAKEAREKTQEYINGRLPTCISNIEFKIREACSEGKNYILIFVPDELYYQVESYFNKLDYTVSINIHTNLWYKKTQKK